MSKMIARNAFTYSRFDKSKTLLDPLEILCNERRNDVDADFHYAIDNKRTMYATEYSS